MKKILSIILVLALCLSLASCGGSGNGGGGKTVKADTPTDVVTNFFNSIKTEDAELLEASYAGENMDLRELSNMDSEDPDELDKMMADKLLSMIKDFDFKLSNEQIDGDKATVDAEITAYNIGEAISNFMTNFLAKAMEMATDDVSDEEIEKLSLEILTESLDAAEKNYTETVTLELTKSGDTWLVNELENDSDVINAILGNLMFAVSDLGF